MKKPMTVWQYCDHILREDIQKHVDKIRDIKTKMRVEADKEKETRCSTTWRHASLQKDKERVRTELRVRYMALAWFRNRAVQDVEASHNDSKQRTYNHLQLQKRALRGIVPSVIARAKTIYKLVNATDKDCTKDRVRKEAGHTMLSLTITVRRLPDDAHESQDESYYEVDRSSPSLRNILRQRSSRDQAALLEALMPPSLSGYSGTIYADVTPGKYKWEGSAVFGKHGVDVLVDTFTRIKEETEE